MKKIFILINSFLIIFCLFVPINADEEELNIDESEINENIDETKTIDNKELIDKIDNLEKEIFEIRENNTKANAGSNGSVTNYNKLNANTLSYLYDHWNEYAIICIYKNDNPNLIILVKNEDVVSIDDTSNVNYATITYSKFYYFFQDTQNISTTTSTQSLNYWYNHISDDNTFGFLKFSTYYNLQPYTLNILNNGLGSYTNSVNTEPYLSTNIYYSNQSITLTYDDTYEDFTGWYDTNGNLVSNQNPYTFNIDQNTNLVINYYSNPVELDYTNLLYIIIGLLTFILFNDLTKGVLN